MKWLTSKSNLNGVTAYHLPQPIPLLIHYEMTIKTKHEPNLYIHNIKPILLRFCQAKLFYALAEIFVGCVFINSHFVQICSSIPMKPCMCSECSKCLHNLFPVMCAMCSNFSLSSASECGQLPSTRQERVTAYHHHYHQHHSIHWSIPPSKHTLQYLCIMQYHTICQHHYRQHK